jgi:hypothetical protein
VRRQVVRNGRIEVTDILEVLKEVRVVLFKAGRDERTHLVPRTSCEISEYEDTVSGLREIRRRRGVPVFLRSEEVLEIREVDKVVVRIAISTAVGLIQIAGVLAKRIASLTRISPSKR